MITFNHLIVELKTILNLLTTYNLSADELLLIYLTFLAQDEQGHSEYFVTWFENGGKEKLRPLFESLKEKGIIHKNYNPESYIPNDIEFNKTFTKGWIKNTGLLGQELFEKYPSFCYINGKMCPLKNISKRFYSLDEFYFHYSSTIGHSVDKHKEIMDLLQWAKDNDLIRYGILEFVASHKWEELKVIRENKLDNQLASSQSIYLDE